MSRFWCMKHIYINYLLYHMYNVVLDVSLLVHETYIHQLSFVPQVKC